MFMCALAIILSSPALPVRPAPDAQSRVAVHLITAEVGDAEELGMRKASMKDLAAALAKKKKLLLVEAEGAAEVVVEVLGRTTTASRIVIGVGSRPGQTPAGGEPARSAVLRVKISSRGESAELTNKNKPNDNPNGWRSAAEDLAGRIEKWIGERRVTNSWRPLPAPRRDRGVPRAAR